MAKSDDGIGSNLAGLANRLIGSIKGLANVQTAIECPECGVYVDRDLLREPCDKHVPFEIDEDATQVRIHLVQSDRKPDPVNPMLPRSVTEKSQPINVKEPEPERPAYTPRLDGGYKRPASAYDPQSDRDNFQDRVSQNICDYEPNVRKYEPDFDDDDDFSGTPHYSLEYK